jgi:hypothetical protein
MGLAICFTACQTDGEYADNLVGRVTPVQAEFKYIADPEARFAVEYADVELSDTLPYDHVSGRQFKSRGVAYIKENSMSNLLRVYRLENGKRIPDLEAQVEVLPVVVQGDGGNNSMINLAQLAAGSPVQILSVPEAPTDSSSIAVQFFYGDASQPEEVKITILAVDNYSLTQKKPTYTLSNVPEELKDTVTIINLRRAELSEPVVLNLNIFGEINEKKLAAKFYYCVHNAADNSLLQDYKVSSSTTNAAEINPEASTIIKTHPVYKSAVMQFTYKDASMKFASPKTLARGEKW